MLNEIFKLHIIVRLFITFIVICLFRLTMATSLAAQLKKLRTPQTNLLLLDKKRPSLLFDPKEAANLDRDTVLSIG